VLLQAFSPTGFYSSAVRTDFLGELEARSRRQMPFTTEPNETHTAPFGVGPRKRLVYLKPDDLPRAQGYTAEGFTEALRTPDDTLVFETPAAAREILNDQTDCMGCLSHCRFSNWAQTEPDFSTGKKADPRSFCIQKTLQDIAHGGRLERNLMFSGHNAYRFGTDPFYSNGFVPTAKQLVERIMTGR